MWGLAQVALGGAIGSAARYLAVLAAHRAFGMGFPVGTLLVNVIGSFVMGALFVTLAGRGQHLLLMTGVLGGFTTFSAFSLDAFKLWEAGQSGAAALYVALSVALSLAALALAVWLFKGFLA